MSIFEIGVCILAGVGLGFILVVSIEGFLRMLDSFKAWRYRLSEREKGFQKEISRLQQDLELSRKYEAILQEGWRSCVAENRDLGNQITELKKRRRK